MATPAHTSTAQPPRPRTPHLAVVPLPSPRIIQLQHTTASQIVGRGHLEQVLPISVEDDNRPRPHQPLGLEPLGRSAGLTLVGEDRRGGCTGATYWVAWFGSRGGPLEGNCASDGVDRGAVKDQPGGDGVRAAGPRP